MNEISIAGLTKASVLAALYNGAQQIGMGFMNPRGSSSMSEEDAQKLIDGNARLYFDYVHGRVMKIGLKSDTLNTALYNRDNGDGAAERIIEALREKETAST
jgi:hypothetical protein